MRGKLAGQPTRIWRERQQRLWKGVTERQYGHDFTETVTETDTDERERNAGNKAIGGDTVEFLGQQFQ